MVSAPYTVLLNTDCKNMTNWSLLKTIITETWRGKSLPRIFLNVALSTKEVSGEVLDLGASAEAASYRRFLKYLPPFNLTTTDFYKTAPGMVALNVEEPFVLQSETYNYVTCFNVLEHVYNYTNAVQETFRILKPGGTFIGGTPFLVNVHPDPNDYWRYTTQTLEKILMSSGFTNVSVESLGRGPATASAHFFCTMIPKWLRLFFVLPALALDALFLKLFPIHTNRYPLAYIFTARKP